MEPKGTDMIYSLNPLSRQTLWTIISQNAPNRQRNNQLQLRLTGKNTIDAIKTKGE